jgi:protein-S-isoprenylcysteine O-methyltransferase Ste14
LSSDLYFRIIQGLIFIVFVANRAYYNRRYPPLEDETLEKQERGLVNQLSNLLSLVALISLVLYLIKPDWMSWASLPMPVPLRWAGVLIAFGGFALLQWSQGALGRNWSDQPRITEGQTFVIEGPYRWVRHPIYSAFVMILGSTLFITANWFIGGLWLVITLIDVSERIKFEESRMLAQFGDEYQSYMQRTGSLFPRTK